MPLDLKEFVKRHETRGEKKYSPSELHELCSKSIEVFKKEPTLLKIESPVAVAGNTCGCFHGMLRFCELYDAHKPAGGGVKKKLFIGNYSECDSYNVETISCVLGLKLRYPNEVFVLRGNEEHLQYSKRQQSMQQQLIKKFGNDEAEKLLLHLSEVYSWMPLAALVDGKIFGVNGGIPPQLKSLEQIQKISRPLVDPSKNDLAFYMLNSNVRYDCAKVEDYLVFNEDDIRNSLRVLGLSKIIRTSTEYCGMTVAVDKKFYSISSNYVPHENMGGAIFIDKQKFQPVAYNRYSFTYGERNINA